MSAYESLSLIAQYLLIAMLGAWVLSMHIDNRRRSKALDEQRAELDKQREAFEDQRKARDES